MFVKRFYIFIVLALTIFASCEKTISNQKARKEYKKDPKGFILVKDTIYLGDDVLPCIYNNNKKYRSDLINDTSQYNWYFHGYSRGFCLGTLPMVDFAKQSLVIGAFYGDFGTKSTLATCKLLINYKKKIILVKALVIEYGGADRGFYPGFIITKMPNDYEVIIEHYDVFHEFF